jgi:hypothetical protein
MQKIYVVKFSHFLGLCKLTAPNHPPSLGLSLLLTRYVLHMRKLMLEGFWQQKSSTLAAWHSGHRVRLKNSYPGLESHQGVRFGVCIHCSAVVKT